MSNLRRHPRKSSSRSSPIPFRSLEKGLVLAGIGVVLMLAQVFTGGAVLASSFGAEYSYGSALDLGSLVDIHGVNFSGATQVDFGSTPAISFTVDSDTMISAVSPAGSGTVDITVTTSAGTSATSSADQFTYVTTPPPPPGQPPKIISASPKTGPKSGGTQVFIYGSNFTGATKVDFGTQSATFTILSDSEILATSPAGTGQVSLSVKNSAGTSPTVAQAHFTYNSSKVPMLNRNSAANSYSYLLAILHRLTEFEIPVLEHFL